MMLQEPKPKKLERITSIILSIKFWYLLFFIFGMVCPYWIQYPNIGWPEFYLTIGFVFIAIVLKMILVLRELTIKQFFVMQSQYMIPYCFMVINIILWIKFNNAFRSQPQFLSYSIPLVTTQAIFYFEKPFICSLIMNKKTTSVLQFWIFIVMLLYATGFNVYLLISDVDNLNQNADFTGDILNNNTISFILNQNQTDYDNEYQIFTGVQAALQSAKDYSVALIASSIAELLIIMDMLGRPIQKLEADQQKAKRQKTYLNKQGQNSNLSQQRQKSFLAKNEKQTSRVTFAKNNLDSGQQIKKVLL